MNRRWPAVMMCKMFQTLPRQWWWWPGWLSWLCYGKLAVIWIVDSNQQYRWAEFNEQQSGSEEDEQQRFKWAAVSCVTAELMWWAEKMNSLDVTEMSRAWWQWSVNEQWQWLSSVVQVLVNRSAGSVRLWFSSIYLHIRVVGRGKEI